MKHMLLATVAVIGVLSFPALGQTLPQGVQKGPSMGGITEYDFPNGLTVLLYPDQANPKVTVDVTTLWARATKVTAKPAWLTCWST